MGKRRFAFLLGVRNFCCCMVQYGSTFQLSTDTMAPMSIESLRLEKLGEVGASSAFQVERDLREAIIRLELLPGTRLSEQEIADRLGVSRQPVREALIALAKSKLVEVRSKRGTYVVK